MKLADAADAVVGLESSPRIAAVIRPPSRLAQQPEFGCAAPAADRITDRSDEGPLTTPLRSLTNVRQSEMPAFLRQILLVIILSIKI